MKKRQYDTKWMVGIAMMMAIMLVLYVTRLGFIPIPLINATTMHIPVIIGAIVYGPVGGSLLGAVFGITSMFHNMTSGSLLAFAFSPFMSTTGMEGVLKSIWVSVGCRILIGLGTGWLWGLMKRIVQQHQINQMVSLAITAFVGSMINTITVMGSIGLLFTNQYAEAKEIATTAVWGTIMGTVATLGIPEAIVAIILVPPIVKGILKIEGH